jgi:CotH protein/chitobiase/beta-hexosaminidase-like protein
MTPEGRIKAKRVCQCLSALAMLALVTAQFENSSFRRRIRHQLYALSYLRSGGLRDKLNAPPRRQGSAVSGEAPVRVDFPGGFYERPLKVTLSDSMSRPIFYTLDGSPPQASDEPYSAPIAIEHTTVLRFVTLPGGPEEVHTYVIGDHDDLPVLSVAMDPAFLWNRHAGIYSNPLERGRAWWRPAQVELLAVKESVPTRFPIELKIHGNWSRRAEKKSFKMSYAAARVAGPDPAGLLGRSQNDAAQRTLVVRAMGMNTSYRLGDELFRAVFAESGGLTVRGANVQLLLNGRAWGLYNLYEEVGNDYLQRVYGSDEYEWVDDAGYRPASNDPMGWNQLLEFFSTHDLSDANEFAKATQLIDVKNFTDYWLFNIYAANLDWPQNNYYAFRKRSGDQRWRWISWDADAAFDVNEGLHHDTLSWAIRSKLRHDLAYAGDAPDDEEWMASTVIIRALLKNAKYRVDFVRRFCELRNTYFKPELLRASFQRLLDRLAPHWRIDWERWPGSKQAYASGVQGVRRFIAERPAIVLEQFRKEFAFSSCPAG